MRKRNILIIVSISVVVTLGLAVAIPFTILGIRTANLKADYSYLTNDAQYSKKVEINNVELVK